MNKKSGLDFNGSLSGRFEESGLTRKELESLPADRLAEIILWQRQVVDTLNDRLLVVEGDQKRLQSIANRLSIDSKTGILTVSALHVLSDLLFDSHVLEMLKERGYTLKLCFLDVDELKKHNSLGGHDGGDEALNEVAKRLKILYRRKTDVVACGVLDFLSKAHRSLTYEDALTAEGRYERGDEMVAWRYSPPKENDVRRRGSSPRREVSRIKRGFEGASVSYPLLEGLGKDDIKRLDPESRFKVKSGIVTAPISISFACVHSPMPTTRHEARLLTRAADHAVALLKARREGRPPQTSEGVAIVITADDLM